MDILFFGETTARLTATGTFTARLGLTDYAVLLLLPLLSATVGFYHASSGKTPIQTYINGNRKINSVQIGLSLAASFFTSISVFGNIGEVYLKGTHYIYILISLILAALLSRQFLEVFYKMHCISIHEYLEKRFSKPIRILGSILFCINSIAFMILVSYVPGVVLYQFTGWSIYWTTSVTVVICVIYTNMGGFKTVVWTQLLQIVILIGTLVFVAVKGTNYVGSVEKVWWTNWNNNRIQAPNMDVDPFTRHTIWTSIGGGTLFFLHFLILNQIAMNKYLSLPDFNSVKRSLWIFLIAYSLVTLLTIYCGIMVYAAYYKCDPLTTKLVQRKDQMLPLFVMQTLSNYPGLPGLFVMGIFSVTFSSLAAVLHSLSVAVSEDFCKWKLGEMQTHILLKFVTVFVAVTVIFTAHFAENLETFLQSAISILSISSGPCLALFLGGMMFPWIHSKGIAVGTLVSIVAMCWLRCEAINITAREYTRHSGKTEGCQYNFTLNLYNPIYRVGIHTEDQTFVLFKISYMYYTTIGASLSILISLITSFVVKPIDPRDLDSDLLTSFTRRLISPRKFPNQPCDGIIYAYERTAGV